MGFLSFWGLFWLVRRVFSGSGFFWFLASSCLLAVWSWGVGGRVVGGFSRVRGWCAWFLLPVGVGWVRLARSAPAFLCGGWVRVRLVPDFPVFWGVGVGCVCLVHSWDAVSGGGSGGPAPFSGVGCAWFPVRVRGGFRSCSRRGFRVFLFPLGASFLWFGGCRVGLGLFFLRLFCPVRVRVGSLLGVGRGSGSGVGFVWRV